MTATPTIDGNIVGELLLGELPNWEVGVCTLTTTSEAKILVLDDGDHPFDLISTERYIESPLDGSQVKDLSAIATDVNEALEGAHAEL